MGGAMLEIEIDAPVAVDHDVVGLDITVHVACKSARAQGALGQYI